MNDSLSFYSNEVLFSFDRTERIVAVEHDEKSGITIFIRNENEISTVHEPFHPFIIVSDESILDRETHPHELIALEGSHALRFLLLFNTWKERDKALKVLKNAASKADGASQALFFSPSDPVHQYLLLSGKTLFKGLSFDDLHRMQLDIETFCAEGYEFSNPEREEDRITLIALSDNRGFEHVISGSTLDEASMLKELVRIITEKDPDIIEGHNINKFDFWYIEERAKRHKVPLRLGRNGAPLRAHPSQLNIAERTITYWKYEIYGRHIVDTWILAQLYDISYRGLESYGLKDIARHFNVAGDDRTYLPPDKLSWYFLNEPDTLMKYCLDDVRETAGISEILSSSYFIQAQIFPYSYQNTIVRGNATRIDSLFIREYLRNRHSIPIPSMQRTFEGGYADIFYQGILHNILHCDVQSLYPSLMLSFRIYPGKDDLAVFPRLLSDLREFRLGAKEMMRRAEDEKTRRYYDALQSTFKILINSFYGYLGFAMGHFSDFGQAAEVARKGREILTKMIETLREARYIIAEIDTDGIYFSPPESETDTDENKILSMLSKIMPPGITVEIDGSYRAMFSYKVKNYVLLNAKNAIVIKGSGLKSRGLELFQRRFMEELFRLLLTGEKEKIETLYEEYSESFRLHRFPPRIFCKTETLQEAPLTYMAKVKDRKRNASAAYELALTSGVNYSAGDQISYYVSGKGKRVKVFENAKLVKNWDPSNPDENVEYYLDKLTSLYGKFKPFIEHDQMNLLETGVSIEEPEE
ncbi:MAG: DNA polymerase domain-containing protein [Candidatus Xenobiia bacterium LiM19]